MEESISDAVSKIRNGESSPLEIFESIIKKIEQYDDRIRSYVTLNESAIDEVRELSRLAEEGMFRGPLHGIPLSVKDLIDTEGIRTTYGNRRYSDNVPARNAIVIDELLASGSYIIGKTNTHEFALGVESPPTVNPFDTRRVPGGSSGGSAAAIAADMAVFALGSDTGGSIRIPAAWCGVTGFKPTYGLVPTEGVFPESWTLDHVGPIVRYAEDIPLVMQAMGAPIEQPGKVKPFRAALIHDFLESSSPAVSRTVQRAVDKLGSSGIIEIAEFKSDALADSLMFHEIIDLSEIATVHGEAYRNHEGSYMAASIEQIEAGLKISAPEYLHAVRERENIYRRICRDMGNVDILISPTLPDIAPLISSFQGTPFSEHDKYIQFQAEFNYLGMPALTVPCGFVDSMPVGLQIVSRRNEDFAAVSTGIKFQEITDWHLSRPSMD